MSEFPKDIDITIKLPISFFDGYEVREKESGKFMGWVDSKNKCIKKYVVKEIIYNE